MIELATDFSNHRRVAIVPHFAPHAGQFLQTASAIGNHSQPRDELMHATAMLVTDGGMRCGRIQPDRTGIVDQPRYAVFQQFAIERIRKHGIRQDMAQRLLPFFPGMDHRAPEAAALRNVYGLNGCSAGDQLVPHAQTLQYQPAAFRQGQHARVGAGTPRRTRFQQCHRQPGILQRQCQRGTNRAAADDQQVGIVSHWPSGSRSRPRSWAHPP
ncbi:hypothetical protein GALL_314340 [mine drainage metagenome]|uniref:Uncharacterized protein n=1 Tax=mine drainage metagenome TaxID=410659 RepID=A0A1J5R3S4_9ZZZZ